MDLRLPLLADANLHLGVAEELVEEGSFTTARSELEKADAALGELRDLWPDLAKQEQGLLGAMAAPLSDRAEKVRSKLPKMAPISVGTAVEDPEQEEDPDADLAASA